MEKQIKPCPFCGCIPEIEESCLNFGEYSINGFKVSCECGVETRTKIYEYDGHSEIELKTKVIDIWNKRADGWISVKDRLPEGELVDVIACLKNKTVHKVVFSTISSEKWFVVGVGLIHPDNPVTHWMPLPEVPK